MLNQTEAKADKKHTPQEGLAKDSQAEFRQFTGTTKIISKREVKEISDTQVEKRDYKWKRGRKESQLLEKWLILVL